MALAQYLRCEVLERTGLDQAVLDNPLKFSRPHLIRQFEKMERIRDQTRRHLRSTIMNLHDSNYQLPGISLQKIQNTLCALELWICTMGVGFAPEKKQDVRFIWRYLSTLKEVLEQVITSMRQTETEVSYMTGIPSGEIFTHKDFDEWLLQCNFIPLAFVQHAA